MHRFRSAVCLLWFCCCLAGLNLGCGPGSPPQAPPSKVDIFKATQAATITPHGRINIDTVQETADGRIQYQTEDGRVWLVTMAEQPDGTYQYGTPEEVK